MNTIQKFFDTFEDRMFGAFDEVTKAFKPFLPYNIYKKDGGNTLVYELAVAGFDKSNIKIVAHETHIEVTGKSDKDSYTYMYKGISTKDFNFTIPMATFFSFDQAKLENGLLQIIFVRNKLSESKEVPIN